MNNDSRDPDEVLQEILASSESAPKVGEGMREEMRKALELLELLPKPPRPEFRIWVTHGGADGAEQERDL